MEEKGKRRRKGVRGRANGTRKRRRRRRRSKKKKKKKKEEEEEEELVSAGLVSATSPVFT